MKIVDILKQDYSRFPENQTYTIYAKDVYFKDPLNEFKGVERYQKMIGFISTWFINVQMDLHEIDQSDHLIKTRWTLNWTAPVPWKPRISIPGWSELQLNSAGLICSHIDYWNCSRFDVVKQLFTTA